MIKIMSFLWVPLLIFGNSACGLEKENGMEIKNDTKPAAGSPENSKVATFGAGCFWCVEAVFQDLKGVHSVISGYSGGQVQNPTYEQVCSGTTGHAEVCQIFYDPKIITYSGLLEVFWQTHDPTTLNRQGADAGSQYRSVIFYHDEEQRRLAEATQKELSAAGVWKDPIVTEISPFEFLYKAEGYHQDYYSLNPNQPYCRLTILPKVEKVKKLFRDQLKK
jgi:peptide-methionine (S)-S-oxide reductase